MLFIVLSIVFAAVVFHQWRFCKSVNDGCKAILERLDAMYPQGEEND